MRVPLLRSGWRAAVLTVAVAALAPAGASAFEKAVWGPPTVRGINQFPLYRSLGAKIYEAELDWDTVARRRPVRPTQPRDPAYVWPKALTREIATAQRFGMSVLLEVGNAPAWANGGHRGPGWAPLRPIDYALFIKAAARRYPSVHMWMIWGEPNRKDDFRPEVPAKYTQQSLTPAQQRAPHLYAQILDAAYGVLKGMDRRNVVIGGNTYTAGLIDPQQWMANLVLPSGRRPRLDLYGHNPFSYTVPLFKPTPSAYGEVQFADLPRLEAWTKTYFGHAKPLFLSEFCVPTAPDRTFNFYISPPSVAARWVKDALVTARHAGYIAALGWVNIRDHLPFNSCGLIQQNGRPKPDFFAFKNN
ncbi:MAG TPA: hypothetical protein VFN36_02790 [Solirubrobacteraceae bacterium]|nr:hypothetical protein [Solirubrobacteraceae bacterium]